MAHTPFCFLIIERDSFIAQDMAEGLAEASPDCLSRRYASIEALLDTAETLPSLPALPVIITKQSLSDIDATGLGALAERHDWPVVVRLDLDPPEAVAARGWLTLPSPFTRPDLMQMVEELLAELPRQALRRA
ncbi:hypothetical protein [Paracoccus tibetensis]|uniref:Response regulatory domain-containing protein n=1 Tax=Paracoccus tibetensis TaxID=336292 RepID=A0A1G5H6F0_9RHOB|nr:hypothetical protein [Paracoccus tibetensis]SCY59241.1 hypothetical protein SAMN05660710_02008 [Paracoccus tibetensis]